MHISFWYIFIFTNHFWLIKIRNQLIYLKGKWITFICYQELKWFLLSQRFNRTLVLSFDSYSLWYIFIFINHFWLIKIRIQFISLKWKWITFNCYQEIKWYVLSQRFHRTLVLSFDSFFLLIYFHLYQSFLADKDSNPVHIFKGKMNNFYLLSRTQMISSFSEV